MKPTEKPRKTRQEADRKPAPVRAASLTVALAEHPEVRALLENGRRRGYVTFDEVNDALPAQVTSCDEIDLAMTLLGDNDIELTNGPDSDADPLSILRAPGPTPPPPAPASLRSTYDLRSLANVLVEAQRWEKSRSPDAAYHLAHAKAAASAFGIALTEPQRIRRERTDRDELNLLVLRLVKDIVGYRTSPFGVGLEGKPNAADLLARQFRDRFEACEQATTRVLDDLLMATLEQLLGREAVVTNDDLLKHGFDPWATPPTPEDDW